MPGWTTNAMLAERNRLAKLLNQRMVRLEKAGIDYGAIAQYKEWISEYYGTSKTGLLRFPEKRTGKSAGGWNVAISLRRELDKLDYFVNAKWETATVKGARRVMQKRMERFEEFGLHFPSEEIMNEFLKSESWRALKQIYGSGMALRLAGKRSFSRGSRNRRSTVAAMDARLQKFLKRMGAGYDLRNLGQSQIEKIFGINSEDIMEVIEEADDLP